MLAFIFQDARYQKAEKGWHKSLIALLIILSTLGTTLFDTIMWMAVAILSFIAACVMYSNFTLMSTISTKTESFSFLGFSAISALSCIIFLSFTAMLLTYLMVYLFGIVASRVFYTKDEETADSRNLKESDNLDQKKPLTLKLLILRIVRFFKGVGTAVSQKDFLVSAFMIFLVLTIFETSWRLNGDTVIYDNLKFHYLPNFPIEIAKQLHLLLKSGVDAIIAFLSQYITSPRGTAP